MSKEPSQLPNGLAHIVGRLNAEDPKERDLAADELTDFAKGLDPFAAAMAGVVVMAYLSETTKAAAVSQLFVLGELCKHQDIPAAVCKPITDRLTNNTCGEWEREYIQDIADLISWNDK